MVTPKITNNDPYPYGLDMDSKQKKDQDALGFIKTLKVNDSFFAKTDTNFSYFRLIGLIRRHELKVVLKAVVIPNTRRQEHKVFRVK